MLRDSALQFEHIQRGHIHTREGMNQLEHEQVEEGDFDKVRRSRTLRRGSCPLLPTIKRPSRDASLIAHVTELIAQVLDFSVVRSPSKMPGLVEEGHDEEVERKQTASENSGTCAPGFEPDKSAMHSEHVDSETHLSHRIATELRRARSSSLVIPSRVHTPRYRHRSQSMAIPSNESHLLRQSVAELVLELTLEQQNSRFAATAGSALLEQLELAKEKESTLQEQLQLQQNDLDTVKNENTRLKQICHRMEVELKEYDSLWSERVINEAGKGEMKSLLLGVEAQGPSLSTITLMTCQNCEKLQKVNEQLRHEIQTLKRRCIELELQHDKAESRWSEIATLHKKSEGCLTRVQTDYTKALSDIDFMSAQIKYLKEDHCQLLASRDSIMAAGRKLQAANEELTAQLEQANDVTENLKLEKNDLNLRAQIAENRIETLTKENHAQFETTRSLLTRIHELELNQTDAHALRTHTEDLEHLVSAVQRELADVREENQRLLIRLRTQTFQGVTQTRVDESNQSMPVPHDTESNMGEILSFDMEHQSSCNSDFGDIQPRSELEDKQVTQAAMSNICAANHSRAIFSSSNSDMELGSATKTSDARRSKKPSLVYTRPSIGRCHRLYTQVAPIRRRKFSENIMSTPKLPTQRLLTADDDNLDMDDEGDIMTTMSTPLCLGLSILACATAVRYIIKK